MERTSLSFIYTKSKNKEFDVINNIESDEEEGRKGRKEGSSILKMNEMK